MKKLLLSLMALSALAITSDSISNCRSGGCHVKERHVGCSVPTCTELETREVKVPAECETVRKCWCPDGSTVR